MLRTQQVADGAAADAAHSDDTVENDDTPAAASAGFAGHRLPRGYLLQKRFRKAAVRCVKLGRVEVGQAHFDPRRRIIGSADAKTVPIANVTHRAGKLLTSLAGEAAFTRISSRGCRRPREQKGAQGKARRAEQSPN